MPCGTMALQESGVVGEVMIIVIQNESKIRGRFFAEIRFDVSDVSVIHAGVRDEGNVEGHLVHPFDFSSVNRRQKD